MGARRIPRWRVGGTVPSLQARVTSRSVRRGTGGGQKGGSVMIRRSQWLRGRLLVLPLVLLAGITVTALGRGSGLTAWAADPTVRYISHRFPMLELWAKKMGDYPGIKFEAELIPFDQA